MAEKPVDKPNKGGHPSKKSLYASASKYAPEAIEILAELMRHGDNDSVKLGAAKVLLAKSIPDLRAIEISGDKDSPISIILDIHGKSDFQPVGEIPT